MVGEEVIRNGRGRAIAPWLALAACLVAGYFWFEARTAGRLDSNRNDGYLAASQLTTPREMLASLRSPGYPQFLRFVRATTGDLAVLPRVQAVLFLAAVAAFFAALCRFGVPAWTALLAAAPAVASPIYLTLSHRVLTDTLGLAAVFCVLSALLLALASGRWPGWLGLAGTIFVAYQIRPVYVCLVPAVIVLAFFLRRPTEAPRPLRERWRPVMATALAATLPLLVFSGFRWALVGHFGLVSFTGHNLIGIAGSLLTPEAVEALSAQRRELARTILAGRTELGLEPVIGRRFRSERDRIRAWHRQFNPNIWKIGSRAAHRSAFQSFAARQPQPERLSSPGHCREHIEQREREIARWKKARYLWGQVEADRRLFGLSLELLRRRPGLYLKWIVHGLREAPAWAWRTMDWLRVGVGLFAVAVLVFVGRAVWGRSGRVRLAGRRARETCAPLLWLALVFAVSKLALVVLLGIPTGRYTEAALVLVPGACLACAWELLRASFAAPAEEAG